MKGHVHSVPSSPADPAKLGGDGWLLRSGLEAGDRKEGQMQEKQDPERLIEGSSAGTEPGEAGLLDEG